MANIPKSYQYPNSIIVDLAIANPNAHSLFTLVIHQLKLSRTNDIDTNYIVSRMRVDCTFLKRGRDRSKMTAIIRNMKYLCDCNILQREGGQKSWIYYINPLVYNKFRRMQREHYESNFDAMHIFQPIQVL